jgi:cellobiose phosphorylase
MARTYGKKLAREHGAFSPDGMEYVITEPNLGKPWVNFITNKSYGIYLSHTGGGFSMYNQELRINHYEPRDDEPGKWVYVRDDADGDFWSLTWGPVKGTCPTKPGRRSRKLDSYRCRVGFGYNIFETRNKGIEGSLRIFVSEKDPVEMWTVTLTNRSKRRRRLSVYPFQAWKLTGFVRTDNVHEWFCQADHRPKEQAIIGEYFDPHNLDRTYEGFFHSELKPDSYDCSGQKFRGTFYDGWANPAGIRNGKLGNSRGYCEQTIACQRVKLTLNPGQTKQFTVVAGYGDTPAARRRLIRKYGTTTQADREFEKVKAGVRDYVAAIDVHTPSPSFDLFSNIWLKNQIYVMATWKSRGGSFRNGFRDTLQDARAAVTFEPQQCRDLIIEALQYQYPDGHCLRQWSLIGDHDYRYYVDSPYWIAYALTSYIKETGDLALLDEKVPYFSGPGLSVVKTRSGFKAKDTIFEPTPAATVWEHTVQAMRNLFHLRGKRGLCLFGWGDINDAMDLCGREWKGESVWMTETFYHGLGLIIELCRFIGKTRAEREFTEMAREVRRSFNRSAWDGKWFIRGWNDWGEVIGSHKNREGAIHLIPQTWAVLGGIAPEKRLRQALKSVQQKLYCEYGPKLFAPVYDTRDPKIGQMTALRGHMNNNPYTHHAIQLIQAYALLGMGNEAVDLFHRVLPHLPPRGKKSKGFKVAASEPFTISNYYIADDDAEGRGGEAGQGWLTASAGWLFISAIEYILGVRPAYDGLLVAPCLSQKWRKAGITRQFRGDVYDVHIRNPQGVQKGVKSLAVDGTPVKGNVVKHIGDGRTHRVDVVMG